jgi:tetratricopeptide (TPR) repeat protein
MLRELGYTVPGDEPAAAEYPAEQAHADAYAEAPAAQPGYDPSAPLPAWELDDPGTAEALSHRAFAPSQLDDPFAEGLPSFPIDDLSQRYGEGLVGRDSMELAVPAYSSQPPVAPVVIPPAPSSGGSGGQLDEEALEEVEFFANNSMFDEARNLLGEQLQRLPNHPLLLERLRELEEHAAAAQGGGSGTHAVPRSAAPAAPAAGPPSSYNFEDRSFDIAASLDALDALEAGADQAPAHDPNQVSVESVFQQFKAGVAAQISESDASTHYDLGLAYKEMGLVSDAIAEFELAARDPNRACACHSNVGMIYREQGNVDAAIQAFDRGLAAPVKTPEQEVALTYEIGDCYEERRAVDQALYYFQRVSRMSPGYADMRGSVSERIRRLEPAPQPKPAAKAVGAEDVDEFDAVLDDLLGGGIPGAGGKSN